MINIVHNADCRPAMRKMKDNKFDLAIVDPPYGLGNLIHGFARKVKHKRMDWNSKPPDKEYFIELYRISKNQIIWGANYFIGMIMDYGRIVHDKQRDHATGSPIKWSDCDIASQSFNNRIEKFEYRWNGNLQGDIINWDNQGPDARIHPTQKPIALYKWLLNKYAEKGNTIIDTHVGSGSSRIACWEMGFDFVGYEIDKDYWRSQEKRFKVIQNQQTLFQTPSK